MIPGGTKMPSDIYNRPANRQRCACKSWTTANGDLTPLMIKVEDESGEIQTVKNLEILFAEKQELYGSILWIFRCRAAIHDNSHTFVLFYHSKDGFWEISWK